MKYRIIKVDNSGPPPRRTIVHVELDADLREFLDLPQDVTVKGPRDVATLTYDFNHMARETLILSSIKNDIAQRKAKATLARMQMKAAPSGPDSDLAHLSRLAGKWFDA